MINTEKTGVFIFPDIQNVLHFIFRETGFPACDILLFVAQKNKIIKNNH